MKEYGCSAKECRTIGSALEWLEEQRKKQKRRCAYIQRNDLLPLIQSIALKRYIRSVGRYGEYEAKEALGIFVQQANLILSACHMELLNPEKYEMDALLCACYQEEDYYFFSEVLNAFFRE